MAGKRFDSVQGYRFLLFLAVFLFHGVGKCFSFGWGGVMAFLVLSSFFLTSKLYDSDSIDFGKLFVHRIKRLYPTYILLVLGAAIFIYIAKRSLPYDVPAFFLSGQNFFWVLFGWDTPLAGILGHTWYITLDVYLFIIWVLILKFTPKEKWRIVSYIGIVVSIIWRVVCNLVTDDYTLSYTMPWGQLDSFCIGTILALNIRAGKNESKYAVIDTLIGFVGIISCIIYAAIICDINLVQAYQYFANSSNYACSPLLVNIYFFVALLSAGLLRFCLNASSNSILSDSKLVTLGNWSYELYLFHYPFLWLTGLIIQNKWLVTIIAFPLTILTAYLWHMYAEHRVIKILGK